MWSAPPAASTSAWNATASIRRPWSAPWPACQARHSPARAAAVASGPAANARPWPAADPASAAPPRSAAAALPSPWAAASAPLVTDAWSATGDAWSASSPPAAAATPPSDSTATSAAAAALIVSTLRGTAVLLGTWAQATQAVDACRPPERGRRSSRYTPQQPSHLHPPGQPPQAAMGQHPNRPRALADDPGHLGHLLLLPRVEWTRLRGSGGRAMGNRRSGPSGYRAAACRDETRTLPGASVSLSVGLAAVGLRPSIEEHPDELTEVVGGAVVGVVGT